MFIFSWNSFVYGEKESDFAMYLSFYQTVQLPVSLDETFLEANSIISYTQPLDSNFISNYIEMNKSLTPTLMLFDVYKYYPVFKFQLSDSIIGLVYKKEGSSGGSEDIYYMNLYSNDGKKISDLLVAKNLADCSFIYQTTSFIAKDKIIVIQKYFQGDCDQDTYFEKERKEKIYNINSSNGKITIQ